MRSKWYVLLTSLVVLATLLVACQPAATAAEAAPAEGAPVEEAADAASFWRTSKDPTTW